MTPNPFLYANLANLALLEELHAKYLKDPQSVDSSWRYFFEGMEFAAFQKLKEGKESPDIRIFHLIEAYRTYGHLFASIDPLHQKPPFPKELEIEKYHFTKQDLAVSFPTQGFLKKQIAPLSEIVSSLQKTYCGSIGIEYKGLENPKLEQWIQKKIEPDFTAPLSKEQKIHILDYLNKAEMFEMFIHTKYVGQKRFSLEGGETLIPMLDFLLEKGGELGIGEAVIGMAHRGRLNVLANLLGKSYEQIFHEFEDQYIPDFFEGTGDVKYHKGFEGVLKTKSKDIKLVLAANPSHLESVDPVVAGIVRAKQDQLVGEAKKDVLPIMVHGDAAVAGQGVVYETMQLSGLDGYSCKGSIHIVINNQIGFTALPKETRSTRYCTDIARSFGCPIFHVNGDDPEACVYAAILAVEIRQMFGCDVFIDLYCYRKYGHNESDEPTFTQPLEYETIRSKKNARDLYLDRMIQEGVLDQSSVQMIQTEFRKQLDTAIQKVKTYEPSVLHTIQKPEVWGEISTAVPQTVLQELVKGFCSIPEGFSLHPKLQKLLKERTEMVFGGEKVPKIDWGMGEHLAFSSLLAQNIPIRLSGQDCCRGTFSHRQAVWIDQKSQTPYVPLNHMKEGQAMLQVYNSPLSEFGVLGFEFGYSIADKKTLVIWEAQYGDFSNGAQIVIDQYISSCKQKWNVDSSLVLLLPHGYEGAGPEHSSARMERFLQLCGQGNMRVANCTTPGQFFHLLRKQAIGQTKNPLVVFTPKALLRHPRCVSRLEDFTSGRFEEVLDDPMPAEKTDKLVFCQGKIFYEMDEERKKRDRTGITLIRIEQLYPFPAEKVKAIVEKYGKTAKYIWVQEEHQNMGAYDFVAPFLAKQLSSPLQYIGRGRSAAPAAGSYQLHKREYKQLLDQLFLP